MLAERRTFEQLGDDVWRSVVNADVEHHQHVWMIEHSGGHGLLLESAGAIGISGKRSGEDLQRGVTLDPRVVHPVDLTHSSRAKRCNDFVVADARAGGQHGSASLPKRG